MDSRSRIGYTCNSLRQISREVAHGAFIADVPHDYDRYYLYGFGMIESESEDEGKMMFDHCLEFMLSEEPREDLWKKDQ